MHAFVQALRLASVLLLLAAGVRLARRRAEPAAADTPAARALALALILHVLILAARAWMVRFIPLASMQDVLVALALLVLALHRIAGLGARDRWVGVGVCLAGAGLVALSTLGRVQMGVSGELRSVLLPVHVLGALAAYACFTLNFVACVLLVARGSRTPEADCPGLDRIARCCAVAGWALYGVFVMLIGMAWAKAAWGHPWSWDPKETLSLAGFCAYSLYVYFEVVIRPRSQGFRAAMSAACYMILIGTVVLGMLLPGLHSSH